MLVALLCVAKFGRLSEPLLLHCAVPEVVGNPVVSWPTPCIPPFMAAERCYGGEAVLSVLNKCTLIVLHT